MLYINPEAQSNGAHQSQQGRAAPAGWLPVLPDIEAEAAGYLPFISIDRVELGWIAEVSQGTIPEPEQPSAEELAAEARAKRDALLAECDWTQVLDAPIDAAAREAYRVYRQALRDIPEQEGFPYEIQWPAEPVSVKADPDPVDTAFDTLVGGETNA